MAHWTGNTEHSGAKRGGSGYYGKTGEAKAASKIGRRQASRSAVAEGLDEHYADIHEAEQAVEREGFIARSTITVADLPEGNLYVVREREQYEGDRDRLTTASPDNAVAKFNDLVLDPEAWCDHAVVAVYSLLESGDYDFVGRVTRPLVGREVQAMTEFV